MLWTVYLCKPLSCSVSHTFSVNRDPSNPGAVGCCICNCQSFHESASRRVNTLHSLGCSPAPHVHLCSTSYPPFVRDSLSCDAAHLGRPSFRPHSAPFPFGPTSFSLPRPPPPPPSSSSSSPPPPPFSVLPRNSPLVELRRHHQSLLRIRCNFVIFRLTVLHQQQQRREPTFSLLIPSPAFAPSHTASLSRFDRHLQSYSLPPLRYHIEVLSPPWSDAFVPISSLAPLRLASPAPARYTALFP